MTQSCSCRSGGLNSNLANCSCTDCNNIRTQRPLPTNRCSCNNITTNGTNITSTITGNNTALSFDCACQVEFNGLCPLIDFSRLPIVDEGTCEASNRPKTPAAILQPAQCNNEFEYLVAIVAANKNASVLLNLQTY